MLTDFGIILIFFIIGVLFVAAGLIAAAVIRPSKPNPIKNSIYECGEEPIGEPWIKFNIRFYVIALAFLLFDVEVVLLFPWAVVFKELSGEMASEGVSLIPYIAGLIFALILLLGLVYDWAKGYLNWERPLPYIPKMSDLVINKENEYSLKKD